MVFEYHFIQPLSILSHSILHANDENESFYSEQHCGITCAHNVSRLTNSSRLHQMMPFDVFSANSFQFKFYKYMCVIFKVTCLVSSFNYSLGKKGTMLQIKVFTITFGTNICLCHLITIDCHEIKVN